MEVLFVMMQVVRVVLVFEVQLTWELWGEWRWIWAVNLAVLLLLACDMLRFIAALRRAVVVAFHYLINWVVEGGKFTS